MGRLEAGIDSGVGKGVAGAATVTAGTASGFALVLGDVAFEAVRGVRGDDVATFVLRVAGGGLLVCFFDGFAGDGLTAEDLCLTATVGGGAGGAAGAFVLLIASFTLVGDPGADEGSPEVRRLFRREYRCFESSPAFPPPPPQERGL